MAQFVAQPGGEIGQLLSDDEESRPARAPHGARSRSRRCRARAVVERQARPRGGEDPAPDEGGVGETRSIASVSAAESCAGSRLRIRPGLCRFGLVFVVLGGEGLPGRLLEARARPVRGRDHDQHRRLRRSRRASRRAGIRPCVGLGGDARRGSAGAGRACGEPARGATEACVDVNHRAARDPRRAGEPAAFGRVLDQARGAAPGAHVRDRLDRDRVRRRSGREARAVHHVEVARRPTSRRRIDAEVARRATHPRAAHDVE